MQNPSAVAENQKANEALCEIVEVMMQKVKRGDDILHTFRSLAIPNVSLDVSMLAALVNDNPLSAVPHLRGLASLALVCAWESRMEGRTRGETHNFLKELTWSVRSSEMDATVAANALLLLLEVAPSVEEALKSLYLFLRACTKRVNSALWVRLVACAAPQLAGRSMAALWQAVFADCRTLCFLPFLPGVLEVARVGDEGVALVCYHACVAWSGFEVDAVAADIFAVPSVTISFISMFPMDKMTEEGFGALLRNLAMRNVFDRPDALRWLERAVVYATASDTLNTLLQIAHELRCVSLFLVVVEQILSSISP